jgi:uncharacterized membrane protein (Fun14 family)
MLFAFFPPVIRAAIGVVLVVIGILVHHLLLDVTGVVVIVISAVQWLRRRQRPQGPAEPTGSAR